MLEQIEQYKQQLQQLNKIKTDKKYLNKFFTRKMKDGKKEIHLVLFNTKKLEFEYGYDIKYKNDGFFIKDIYNHNKYIDNNSFVQFQDYYLVYSVYLFENMDNSLKIKSINDFARTFNKNKTHKKDFFINNVEYISLDNINDLYNEYFKIDHKQGFDNFKNNVVSMVNSFKLHYEFTEYIEKEKAKLQQSIDILNLSITY